MPALQVARAGAPLERPEPGLPTGGRARDVLAEAIADARREARALGLTDEEIDAELDAWRTERKD